MNLIYQKALKMVYVDKEDTKYHFLIRFPQDSFCQYQSLFLLLIYLSIH
jgi:hypothetical protein